MHLVSALHSLHHQVVPRISIVVKRAAFATVIRIPFCTATISSSTSSTSSSSMTSCSTKKNENLYMVQFTNDGEFMKVSMPEPDSGSAHYKHKSISSNKETVADENNSSSSVSKCEAAQQSPPADTTVSISTSITSATDTDPETETEATHIPETVLQFQRQMRKTQAAKRSSTPLSKSQLRIIHNDKHIIVVNKPSGVLTVPGINSNPCMLTLLHEEYKHEMDSNAKTDADADTNHIEMKREHMIIHRLDMDTSGIVIFAKNRIAMSTLQASFRDRNVSKYYEAVVCGHIHPNIKAGSIDLPLQRDHRFPPFMRVATPESERAAKEVVKDLNHAGWKKIVKKKAKPSQTMFEVMAREYVHVNVNLSKDIDAGGQDQDRDKRQTQQRFPVTRVRLSPITGRTHQLRVHCAAIGHPILGDPTYGIYGEASPNGGFEDEDMDRLVPTRATMDLQLSLDQYVKEKEQVMCLHARELRIQHPYSGEDMTFQDPPAF
jgi:tRNA pseudouridine32 synthase/23S rRNA pseudouridine746 synthase